MSELVGVLGSSKGETTNAGGRPSAAARVTRALARLHCQTPLERWLARDSIIISHPKSGRTWLRAMFAEAAIGGVSFSHAGSGEQAGLTIASLRRIYWSWRNKRILLLIRDPRDTIVSFFFQATRRSRVYSGSFADFVRDPRFGIERVVDFNLLWLSEPKRFPEFKLLTYEQLHRDTPTNFGEAAQFLTGRQLNEFNLKRAVNRSSFEALHAMELSGEGKKRWGARLSPGDRLDPESFKTRRGIIGGWRDYFSPGDEEYAAGLLETRDYFARVRTVERESWSPSTKLPDAA